MTDFAGHDPMSPATGGVKPAPSCAGNRLKHGTIGGDPQNAPRCGAKNRRGVPCQGPAMRGKSRCRFHGGASTGPRTAAGLAHLAAANTKHGAYGAEFGALLAQLRRVRAEAAALTARHIAAQRDAKARTTAAPVNDSSHEKDY